MSYRNIYGPPRGAYRGGRGAPRRPGYGSGFEQPKPKPIQHFSFFGLGLRKGETPEHLSQRKNEALRSGRFYRRFLTYDPKTNIQDNFYFPKPKSTGQNSPKSSTQKDEKAAASGEKPRNRRFRGVAKADNQQQSPANPTSAPSTDSGQTIG